MIIITRDFNIDLKEPSKTLVKKYENILETFHLKQHIVKPSRTQKALIDHITNIPEKLIHQSKVSADETGDHDLPYVISNVR